MTKTLEFLIDGNPNPKLKFEIKRQVLTGRTSRDVEDVLKHLEELRKQGANLPGNEAPVYHKKITERITTGTEIELLSPEAKTSGEVEPAFLIDHDEKIYVTVSSDHTDREVQTYNSNIAKQLYDTVLSPIVWRYDDVIGHWDELIMEAYVMEDGKEVLYQRGKLEEMLRPEVFLEASKHKMADKDLRGSVILGGTFPTVTGQLNYGHHFRMLLIDPVKGRQIEHTYKCVPITWFEKH